MRKTVLKRKLRGKLVGFSDCSSKHTIVLRRNAKLIRLRDVALYKNADAKRRNGRYLAAGISQDGVKRLDKKERGGKTCEGTIYSEKKVLCKRNEYACRRK
ncbi:hypothetical protein ALC56_06422 [Trachymyrmex septentrionalis]|uniref:Uncharacterized protein n=1 Tax=Trachymyrmex septentrionalis TaxID=34720 RepID=A0A195FF57_9HYME|nr:hypothetical protein ALC56_06422 [Trachymyrmex septentrionalis]